MRGCIQYALPAILALASPAITVPTAGSAQAATCLASPNRPTPEGSHWYYRIDHAQQQRKCWHLVAKDSGARETAKAVPQARAARRAPAAAVAAQDQAKPVAQDPQQLFTRDASNVAPDDALVILPPEQPAAPAPGTTAQRAAAASAPAEEAQAPADVSNLSPPVERPAPRPDIASDAPAPAGMLRYVFLVLVALGLAAGAVLYVAEMRRRRSDVLQLARKPAGAPRSVRMPREEPNMPRAANLSEDFETALRQLAQLRTRRAA